MAKTGAASGRRRLSVDARRSQLLKLGVAAFSAEPYDLVAVEAIAAQAGISKGLLYHYFPTKRAFFAACVRQASAEMLVLTEPPAGLAPWEGLEAGLDAFLAYVQAHRLPYRNLLRGDVHEPSVAVIIDETRAALMDRIERGMGLPLDALGKLALRGWLGFVEAATVSWLDDHSDETVVPVDQIRQLLLAALHSLVMALGGGLA